MSVKSFLKHPGQQFEFKESKIKIFILSLLTCYFLAFLTSIFATSFKKIIFGDGMTNKIFDSPFLESHSGTFILFSFVLFLGPLLEELIFRLPMDGKKWTASLSIGIYICLITQPRMSEISYEDWPRIFIGICGGIATYLVMFFYLFERLSQFLKNYSKNHLIYILTILFAFFHISNFGDILWKYIALYPILVLPQFIIGGYLAFIRINLGFWYSVLFHTLINVPASFAILSKL